MHFNVFLSSVVDYLRMCHGHREALHPLLRLGGVLGFQDEGLVSSEDLKRFGDVPAALDVDAADAADVNGEDSLLLGLVLVSKTSTRESEVSALPLLEDLPLATLLFLQLALDNGLGLLNTLYMMKCCKT